MQNMLEELYWLINEQRPCEYRENNAIDKATNVFSKCEEILTKKLEGENLNILIDLINSSDELTANIGIQNFIDGIKTGVKLMMEIFKES